MASGETFSSHSGVLTANILEGDCRLSLGRNQKGTVLQQHLFSIVSQVIISKDYPCASVFK